MKGCNLFLNVSVKAQKISLKKKIDELRLVKVPEVPGADRK